MPVIIGGNNLPSLVGIGLTDLPNMGRGSGPPAPPGSGITGYRSEADLRQEDCPMWRSSYGLKEPRRYNVRYVFMKDTLQKKAILKIDFSMRRINDNVTINIGHGRWRCK